MNLFNSNIQDEITFQMGLNLRLYQEIEQIMKRLILTSSQTIQTTSLKNTQSQDFTQPVLDVWSNRANLEKVTLGGLLTQLEKTDKGSSKNKDSQDVNGIQIALSYDISLITFFDMAEFEKDFKQIVFDRNQFIHHFESIASQDDELLDYLKDFYLRAKEFKDKHLIPCSEALKEHIIKAIDWQISMLRDYEQNHYRLIAYSHFDDIYQMHKRQDGWIIWSVLIQEMQKINPNILNGLRSESNFVGKHTPWTKIIQDIYPKWEFMEEDTAKGGKRLLVKVDNSILKLKNNQLIDIENG